MKAFRYIQYFFYVGDNWGWRIALVILLQEIKGERKYGINTTGADELEDLRDAGVDTFHSTMYMPVSYPLLEQSLSTIPEAKRTHFLDIGCGKGRALCIAAHLQCKQVTGIDFSEKFCTESRTNLMAVQKKCPSVHAEVHCIDAAEYSIPGTVDCIFLFNPFDEIVMQQVVNNIIDSLRERPRELHIIYANPAYKYLFENAGFSQVYYSKKLEQFEVSILNCRP